MFFAYCALEQSAMLWASSYLVLQHGFDLDEKEINNFSPRDFDEVPLSMSLNFPMQSLIIYSTPKITIGELNI